MADYPVLDGNGAAIVARTMDAARHIDDFKRANGSLANDTRYARISTGNGDVLVNDQKASFTDTFAVGSVYRLHEFAKADMAAQARWRRVDNTGGPFIIIRLVDENNYIGLRNSTTAIQVYKNVAGVFSSVASVAASLSILDVLRIEAVGTQITVFRNNVKLIGPVTVANHATAKRAGLVARGAAATNLLDHFRAWQL